MGQYPKSLSAMTLNYAMNGRFLSWLVLIGANAGLLLGYLGWLSPILDVLAHLRTHFIGAGLVAGVALMLPRMTQMVTLVGCVGVVLAHGAGAWVQQAPLDRVKTTGSVTPAGTTRKVALEALTVMTYNTWHSGRDLKALAHHVLRANADVVVLTEFGPNKTMLLDMWRQRYPYQAHCSEIWSCSIAILSKRPWSKQRIFKRDAERAPLVTVTFGEGASAITIAGTHLFRPIDGPTRQLDEIDTLIALLSGMPGSLIVAGDFNTTRWSHAYRTLVGQARLRSATVLAPTWPRQMPQLAIDHLFVRGAVWPVSSRIVAGGASDHLALMASFIVQTGPRIPPTRADRLPADADDGAG